MKKTLDLSPHEKIYLYVTFWSLVTVLFLLFFFVQGMAKPQVTCEDGTIVADLAECPQCDVSDQCGIDQYCRINQCVAKECVSDVDCKKEGNECIYGFCRAIVSDLPDPEIKI